MIRFKKTEDLRMNAKQLRPALRFFAAAGLCACMSGALAQVHYYDGTQVRRLTLQPELRAEFNQGDSRRTTLAASADAVALKGVGDSLVRIVRVTRSSERLANPAAESAAVYREGDSPAGRLMALPGGVLVKFKPDWSRAQIDAWVAARGLTTGRALPIGTNWFRIDTAPGLTSLETANAIFETGEVLSASPNWWMQTRAK